MEQAEERQVAGPSSVLEVAGVFLRLGLTSFGGPVAHLGYFRAELVQRRKWVDDETYADIVALCQFLPGPASSQVGLALGLLRAGKLGALAAWLGFTMPSAILMVAFAYGVTSFSSALDSGWLHGLKVVAVAVVAQAVWGMATSLAPDRTRATIAILAAVVVLLWSTAFSQVAVIIAGGLIGWRIFRGAPALQITALRVPIRRSSAVALLVTFAVLLVGLPVANHFSDSQALAMVAGFYRAGSLVFGGGHVILPLLESVVVPPGWVTTEEFVAGYGAAQAVPGPLFTFSAYLGAVKSDSPNGVAGGLLALLSIFLPSFLLVFGALPFWDVLRARPDFQAALRGINAAVVGILLAALYSPVWTSAILSPEDFALGAVLFGLLVFWKRPPWQVVIAGALGGELIARFV